MNKTSYVSLIAPILLVYSLVYPQDAVEKAKEFATLIENPDAAAFETAYSQLVKDAGVPLEAKIAVQGELLQLVNEQKEIICRALAVDTQKDKRALGKGVLQGVLAVYAAFSALYAIAWGLSSCLSSECPQQRPANSINKIMKAYPRVCAVFNVSHYPACLLTCLLNSFLPIRVCCRSVCIKFPAALLLSGTAYVLGRRSINNCKKGWNYKKTLEYQLEQLEAIEAVLTNQLFLV